MGASGADRRNFNEAERTLLPPLVMKWSQDINYGIDEVDCITVAGGKLFLGSGGDPNKIVCLDATNGDEIWNYSVEGSGGSNDVSPAYLDGKVYFGGQGANKLYVLNAADGSLIWDMDLEGDLYSRAPAVSGGLVYVTGGETLYVIDPTARSVKWSAKHLISAPAVSGGTVFASLGPTNSRVGAFDSNTGLLEWNKTMNVFWWDLPVVSGETVFIGGNDALGPAVFALSKTDGSEKWRAHINSSLALEQLRSGFMAEGDGVLVTVACDAYCTATEVCAFNSTTGSLLWKFRAAGQTRWSHLFHTPTLANGVVYMADYFSGKLYMFSARSGSLLSEYDRRGYIEAQPVISNGTIYVAYGSKIFAFTCTVYDVTVSSAQGGVTIDGTPIQGNWLSKWSQGSNHTLTISQVSQGFIVQKVFDHWLVNGASRTESTLDVTVTGTLQIEAVWRDDYTQLILIAGGGLVLVAVAVVLLMRRGPGPPPPPP